MQGIWLVAFALQWLLLLLLAMLVAGVLRFLASFQEKLKLAAPTVSRFELGESVGEFALPALDGTLTTSTSVIRESDSTLLLLMTTKCSSCTKLLGQLVELASRDGGLSALRNNLVVVFVGQREEVRSILTGFEALLTGPVAILLDEAGALFRDLGVTSVPIGILVDQQGRVRDQSMNPHTNWLYKTMGVRPPTEPVAGRSARIVPAIQLRD